MSKAKIWKIGTTARFYLDEFFEKMDIHNLKQGSSFTVQKMKSGQVFFKFDEELEHVDDTKAAQSLKVLIALNIITPESRAILLKDADFFDQTTYEILCDEKNWRENFIELLESYSYLDEIDEEGNDKIEFTFKKQKDAIFSILKTFEVNIYNEINEYSIDDKKVFGYWKFSELFRDFENELKVISQNLLNERPSKITIRKDLNNITWKELKINNLKEVKDGNLESALWNLADILSSSKNISIPIMQRKYVWSTNLIDKLIDDIFSIGENKPFHYIGSIVYREKENTLRILDGQQRLTSMFLILTALYKFFISDDSKYFEIEVPDYFGRIFPRKGQNNNLALHNRFSHVSGNEDFDEFSHILMNVDAPRKNLRGNMSNNFEYAIGKIKEKFENSSDHIKQEVLENIFVNTVEKVAFTVNKNQIEDEYKIFEKLNTLSEPLNQIDLMKNHILPYCKSEELDSNESDVQNRFFTTISSKFEKNKKVSDAAVKRFVNYFIQLYGQEYLLDKNDIELKPYDKLSKIIECKFDLKQGSKSYKEFISLLSEIGSEIDSFLSITDRNSYINKENDYYQYSDLLSSFEQRYVYAPLIKLIFDLHKVEDLDDGIKGDREKINLVREIIFEIERYELFMQVVLYRGQSISGILDKVSKEVRRIWKENNSISPKEVREIFSDEKIMSSALISPTLDVFVKKVSEDPIADKVSILVLNRIKFYSNNNESIKIDTVFSNDYLDKPSREHIISQKLTDQNIKKQIYSLSKNVISHPEYSDGEFNRLHKSILDMIGNIMMVENSDNKEFGNKSPMDKLDLYVKKSYLDKDPIFIGLKPGAKKNSLSLRNELKVEQLSFEKVQIRSGEIANYLRKIYE